MRKSTCVQKNQMLLTHALECSTTVYFERLPATALGWEGTMAIAGSSLEPPIRNTATGSSKISCALLVNSDIDIFSNRKDRA